MATLPPSFLTAFCRTVVAMIVWMDEDEKTYTFIANSSACRKISPIKVIIGSCALHDGVRQLLNLQRPNKECYTTRQVGGLAFVPPPLQQAELFLHFA